ncbi:MAG: MFS transporter [Thermoleophilia bacterium]|nr:MFS transporter [Thermoleophilia bacterium]
MTRGAYLAMVALLVFTMGTSIITPLLPLYASQFHLSNGTLTLLFATYTATVVPTMLVAGSASDRLGRKRVLLPAMFVLTCASLVFAFTESVSMLFVGRVLQGLAIGMFLGVGTAFVVDHAIPAKRALAAMAAGAFFRLGFGLGPGMAGLVAQYWGDPIHRPFQVHLVLLAVGIGCVILASETVPRRRYKFEIRVGVPKGQMRGFAGFMAPAAFTMSLMEGTVLSIVPLYLYDTLGERNVAIAGLCGFLVLGLGGMTPLVTRNVAPRLAVMIGLGVSAVVTWLIALAAVGGSALLVVVAAGIIGFVNGMILQGATVICSTVVPLQERGKLLSSLYMCAYAGTVPAVGLGYLSLSIGLTATLVVFSIASCVLAAWVIVFGRRLFPRVIPYEEHVAIPSAS